MNKKVLLGMSGGVDSSTSALLLKEQGYEVIGCTLELFKSGSCCNQETYMDAKAVCNQIGIPHFVFDAQKEFRQEVIEEHEYKTKPKRILKGGVLKEMHKYGCLFTPPNILIDYRRSAEDALVSIALRLTSLEEEDK